MRLKTLKAERKYWTDKLSEVRSTESKEYIKSTLEELDSKIERKIMNKQWIEDMVYSTAGIVVGTIIYNRLKK